MLEMLDEENVDEKLQRSLLDKDDEDDKVTETSETSVRIDSEISVTTSFEVGGQRREETLTAEERDAGVLTFPAGEGPPTTD